MGQNLQFRRMHLSPSSQTGIFSDLEFSNRSGIFLFNFELTEIARIPFSLSMSSFSAAVFLLFTSSKITFVLSTVRKGYCSVILR